MAEALAQVAQRAGRAVTVSSCPSLTVWPSAISRELTL